MGLGVACASFRQELLLAAIGRQQPRGNGVAAVCPAAPKNQATVFSMTGD